MFRRVILFLTFCCVSAFSQTQHSRYAIIVGQNDGGTSVGTLQYAVRDAKRVAEVLKSIGDFPKENVILLTDPDSLEIQNSIEKTGLLIRNKQEQDKALFMFYYSGHADINSLLLGKTRFSLEKIQKMISVFPAAFRIAVFDACQSGVVTAFKGGTRAEPFYLQNNAALVKGQAIIASASANERAQESSTLKGSVFTFHWINGLNGSADISADNQITLNEAYQYAYRKTIETSALATGEIQHPVYRFNIAGQGDIVLTNLNKSESGIFLGNDCDGKFLVLSEDFLEVYADFYKEKQRDVFISLNHGSYTIVNARGSEVGTLILALKRKVITNVKQSMFIPNTLTESRIKGHTDSSVNYTKTMPRGIRNLSIGGGSGFVLYPDFDTDNWDRDIFLQVTSSYSLFPKISAFLDAQALLFCKSGQIQAGVDYVKNNGVSDLFLGAGGGMEYAFSQYSHFSDAFSGTATVHAGFTTSIGKHANLQVRIPFTAVFKESHDYRLGVDFSIIFRK
ncbi:MAG: caspase family protein [Fibrobacterota bacterium]|nr:caspase family protein [Chitinispirillaceae bacterium]